MKVDYRYVMGCLAGVACGLSTLAHGQTVFDVPLMRRADHETQQGFVRVASLGTGYIDIDAWDDAGTHAFTDLYVEQGRTYHFNSTDLEDGNPTKGINAGINEGEGDWYLQLSADFDFVVTSYIRTEDGFVTAMGNTLVPVDGSAFGAECAFEASFFNPASNTKQVSSLRIVEYDDVETEVRILGYDDDGDVYGPVDLTVPASGTRTVTAQQLEAGGDGIRDSLGDGFGKWRLVVLTDGSIVVLNLLETPTGHLTNLGPMVSPSIIGDGEGHGAVEVATGCPGAPDQNLVARGRGGVAGVSP
ncbi:MAG: hypothetical protein F4X98_12935 [Gammaproteobacteria bacterium]|nr:hypothetical protein [Gammaproteobacteria bacterium]